MKKILFFAVSCLIIVSCSNEAIDFNNSELIPKKLEYFDNAFYEDSINFNEFGNRILILPETVLPQNYFYNDSQQLIAYRKVMGIDSYASIDFNYGTGESANKVASVITSLYNFNVNRFDNRILIEIDNGALPSVIYTELILQADNYRLIEQLTINDFELLNFYYDSNNNPVLIEVSRYNETSGNYELSFTIEQTFDDKNNFLKNTGQQDIITNYSLRTYVFINDPINGNSNLALLMNQFAPNNLLTRTTTYSSGTQSVTNYEYMYNEYDYPISGTRTTINTVGEEVTRTYAFEYY